MGWYNPIVTQKYNASKHGVVLGATHTERVHVTVNTYTVTLTHKQARFLVQALNEWLAGPSDEGVL